MSRALLRPVLGLRTPLARSFLQPSRALSTTRPAMTPNIETASTPAQSSIPPNPFIPLASTKKEALIAPSPAQAAESVAQLLPLLRAQPRHYITAHIHGRPYLVTQGDHIRLPFKMPGVQPGDVLRLDKASVIGSRDYTLKGSPWVDSALFECRATVLGTESEPMRIKIKKKRRSRRAQRVTSKHKYTILSISEFKILEAAP
ncbi:hypothetical protein F4861DRAFT_425880 [Xylaria intraflava]|nr:hypothetical protein F4861DRAFT_425880 [Xylaria intraflava]